MGHLISIADVQKLTGEPRHVINHALLRHGPEPAGRIGIAPRLAQRRPAGNPSIAREDPRQSALWRPPFVKRPASYRTPPEYAEELGVNENKVLGWIRSGELAAVNTAQNRGGRPRWKISRKLSPLSSGPRQSVPPPPPAPRRRRVSPPGQGICVTNRKPLSWGPIQAGANGSSTCNLPRHPETVNRHTGEAAPRRNWDLSQFSKFRGCRSGRPPRITSFIARSIQTIPISRRSPIVSSCTASRSPLSLARDRFILSGHRRHCAAGVAGLELVPCRFEPIRRDRDPDRFLVLLREYNRQRIKSLDEVLREEVVSADPEESYQSLIDFRSGASKINVRTLDIPEAKRRAAIQPSQAAVPNRRQVDRDGTAALLASVGSAHPLLPSQRSAADSRQQAALHLYEYAAVL